MVFRRKERRYPPINPALFLTQALRSLEEAHGLEALKDNVSIGNALRIYVTLLQTFQNVFTLRGPAGQERVKPLNDKHLVLQIIQVAQETKEGFDRAHDALPIQNAVNIRTQHYPVPSYPADVSYAVTWLRSVADGLEDKASDSKDKSIKTPADPTPVLTVLPAINAGNQLPSEECICCGERFGDGQEEVKRPTRAPTATCTHPADVCANCISQSILAHIDTRGASQPVSCPDYRCSSTFARQDVKEWATDDIFARWDMLSLREMMRKDQGIFIWCQHPTCYSGQLHPEGAAQPIVTCVRCGGKTCFTHNCIYHEGQTCKQYDRSRPVKDALNRSVSRAVIWWKTRNCPGCFQPIQKHGGCRHMHCRCGYYFTWWYAPIHWRRFTPFVKARSPGL